MILRKHLTIEDMVILHNEKRGLPYMTGTEGDLLIAEVVRLREALASTSCGREGGCREEEFLRGALAMRHWAADALGGPAGELVRGLDAETLLPKGKMQK